MRRACAADKHFAGDLRAQRLAREQLSLHIRRAWRTTLALLKKAASNRRCLDTETGGY